MATWCGGLHSTVGKWSVDQPKQLLGADRGPSPEEYVLAALATEALAYVRDHAEVLEVHASARRDLRGHFGSPDSPPEPRALLVQFVGPGIAAAVAAWLAEGTVARLIAGPRPVETTA